VAVTAKPAANTWLILGLVFVAIVLVIAIPNLKLARMTANESSARDSLRAVNAAEARFAKLHPTEGYTCSLAKLGELRLIAVSLASGKDHGYVFEMSGCESTLPSATYRLSAYPAERNQTGYWVFCTDQTGTVKGSSESVEDCRLNGAH
jgi:type IV pilus assembly protein PilA